MRVIGLDHVVLLCRDVEASVAFYAGVLGLEAIDVQAWRDKKAFFPSVRIDESTIIDLLEGVPDGRNTDHLCLVIEPTDMHALAARADLDVVEGRCSVGAHGGRGGRCTCGIRTGICWS
jgi:catechol 2,3-dioxygenase-like lactoylglutathione lyase family enzyme